MLYLNKINNSPKQSYTLVGEEKEQIPFYLWYAPTQQSWFFNISYGDFTANGLQLVVGPNILRNFRNLIPFGLAVTSTDGLDPFYINDMFFGRINLYLLNQDDVNALEASFFNGN